MTAADYAAAAERRPEVQRAAATFRWTGSWHTVFVTPDRFGGGGGRRRFKTRLRRHLERFRMAGYDLEVDAPRYVPLDVDAAHLRAMPSYFRADVLQAVRTELSSDVLPDGAARRVPSRQLLVRRAGLSQPHRRRRAGGRGRRCGARPDSFQRLVDPSATSLDDGVIDDRRARDRPARQQSQLPPSAAARAACRRRQMNDARARPEAACSAARCRQRRLRLLRRHRRRDAPGHHQSRRACRRSPTASATMRSSAPACMPALSSSAFRAAGAACARATTTTSRSA